VKRWALLVVQKDGSSEYLCHGATGDEPVIYRSRAQAEHARTCLATGIGDDVQSINVVKAPTRRAVM
jgi:hypothetical protein